MQLLHLLFYWVTHALFGGLIIALINEHFMGGRFTHAQ